MNILLLTLAVAVAIPIIVIAIEVCAALGPMRQRIRATTDRPRVDILIPAHNEEAVIAATLASIRSQTQPGDRVMVVADNCTDRTAEIARNSGATVVQRFDAHRRGKGFALDYGMRFLEAEHAPVVVIVDADCRGESGTLDLLASTAIATGRPVQSDYSMTCPPQPSPRDVVSGFAVTVKNRVRQRGVARLGGAAILTGSGMAFPWSVLRNVKLDGGNIVEDMQLSFDLLIAGHPPLFCGAARVIAPLPQQRHASKAQRTRWEHGHLQTILCRAPRLLCEAVRQRRFDLLLSAVDLAVPPLSLIVLTWAAVFAMALIAYLLGIGTAPLAVTGGAGLLLILTMWASLARFGEGLTATVVFSAVPRYVLSKIPIYVSFLFRRQKAWVRTDRDAPIRPHIAQ